MKKNELEMCYDPAPEVFHRADGKIEVRGIYRSLKLKLPTVGEKVSVMSKRKNKLFDAVVIRVNETAGTYDVELEGNGL